jgi:phosphomannomutase/phosphoglucomutase
VRYSNYANDDVARHGLNPIMRKTGHSLLKVKLQQEQAALAAEMSGQIFFVERPLGCDGAIYPPLRLVESAAREGSLDSLIAGLARTLFTQEFQIDGPDDRKFDLVEKVATYSRPRGQVRGIDDLRVAFFDRWGLLRGSNAQPALVRCFESAFEQSCGSIRATFEDKPRGFGAI